MAVIVSVRTRRRRPHLLVHVGVAVERELAEGPRQRRRRGRGTSGTSSPRSWRPARGRGCRARRRCPSAARAGGPVRARGRSPRPGRPGCPPAGAVGGVVRREVRGARQDQAQLSAAMSAAGARDRALCRRGPALGLQRLGVGTSPALRSVPTSRDRVFTRWRTSSRSATTSRWRRSSRGRDRFQQDRHHGERRGLDAFGIGAERRMSIMSGDGQPEVSVRTASGRSKGAR